MISRPVTLSTTIFLLGMAGWLSSSGQQIDFHRFVRDEDAAELKAVNPAADGFSRTYVMEAVQVYDLDADSSTYVMNRQIVLLCEEGQLKDKRREGVFSFYLTDNSDQRKRYKIWEKNFANNKLNGPWRIYTLRGGLVKIQTYKNDSLNGPSRTYWIDGKNIMDERDYVNGRNKYIQRTYYKNGKVESEIPYENGRLNGVMKQYYPGGQLSVEQVYKAGKTWEIRANFTAKGLRRKAGTLRNGNGTVIYYNDDGTVREVKTFVNGVAK